MLAAARVTAGLDGYEPSVPLVNPPTYGKRCIAMMTSMNLGLCSRGGRRGGLADLAPPLGGSLRAPAIGAGTPGEGLLQALGVGESLGRVLGQAAQHHAFQVLRDVGAEL